MLKLSEANLLSFLENHADSEFTAKDLQQYFKASCAELRVALLKIPVDTRFVGDRAIYKWKKSINHVAPPDTHTRVLTILNTNAKKRYPLSVLSKFLVIIPSELHILLEKMVEDGDISVCRGWGGCDKYESLLATQKGRNAAIEREKAKTTYATARTFCTKREYHWVLPTYVAERLEHHVHWTVADDNDIKIRGNHA